MALSFAYAQFADGATEIKDFPLDTLTNYINGVGTNGPTKGDLVFLSSGLIRRSKDGTSPPKAIGVLEGVEFLGLVAQGQPYAASWASFNASAPNTTLFPNGVAKVRTGINVVYKIPVRSGQTLTNANRGVAYGIFQDAAGDQTLDTTDTTDVQLKVFDISPDGKTAYVVLNSDPSI